MNFPNAPAVVWFRNDLRTADNLALLAAAQTGNPVIPLFILEGGRDALPLGAAQAWWLHHSLTSLSRDLSRLGAPLILRSGDALAVLREIIAASGARTVLWNRRYAPSLTDRDAEIKAALREDGVAAESFPGQLLHEPTRLLTGSGGPYRVFTPFWRALSRTHHPRPPAPAPENLTRFDADLPTDRLEDWRLTPVAPDWSGGIDAEWTPGENGASERLRRFVSEALDGYAVKRDVPGGEFTSRLSPHLAFGEITPFQIWHAAEVAHDEVPAQDLATFRKEVGLARILLSSAGQLPFPAERKLQRRFRRIPLDGPGRER